MHLVRLCLITVSVLFLGNDQVANSQESGAGIDARPKIENFIALLGRSQAGRASALQAISQNWHNDDAGLLIESARFTRDPRTSGAILDQLAKQSGQDFGNDFDAWYRWIWNQDVNLHPEYGVFKRQLYRGIDPRFADYFSDESPAEIRLDEIRWGGVRRDGIPPLSNPQIIPAIQATYLNDSDVVFGVSFGGKARAYPKRILAWHEMVKDNVGGLSINGVYCTLCGSMIVYETEVNGKHYELGTSGFLYRSNKLMYDHETKSMWSTLNGRPVVGKLVGKGIQLKSRHVVTTTWGQWKADHPDTDVLSLQTGHQRDYGEGVAYRSYFTTDKLMFTVPKVDKRLKNKDEVLVVRAGGVDPIAISSAFLNRNRIYHDKMGDSTFVVVTDQSGANRVYESGDTVFDRHADGTHVLSKDGKRWAVTEDALISEDKAMSLKRLSAHRAFWFGWFADHPDVRLVK